MSRRQRSTAFEGLIRLAARWPWWVGLLAALASYLIFAVLLRKAALPQAAGSTVPSAVLHGFWHAVVWMASYFVPVVLLCGAALSAWHHFKRKNREVVSLQTRNSRPVGAQRRGDSNGGSSTSVPAAALLAGKTVARKPLQPAMPSVAGGAGAAEQTAQSCPLCAQPMVRRRASRGSHAGEEFLGCSTFPICRGTRSLG